MEEDVRTEGQGFHRRDDAVATKCRKAFYGSSSVVCIEVMTWAMVVQINYLMFNEPVAVSWSIGRFLSASERLDGNLVFNLWFQ